MVPYHSETPSKQDRSKRISTEVTLTKWRQVESFTGTDGRDLGGRGGMGLKWNEHIIMGI